jgi:hypothetical protein
LLDNALCERSVNLKEKYDVKESSDSNSFTTVSNFATDLPLFISDEIASPDFQQIATKPKLQISTAKTKYLAPSYFQIL